MSQEPEASTYFPPAAGPEGARLEDLALFANGVAHDVRNPLGVIRTNLYLLRQHAAGQDPKVQRLLHRIDEQVDAALHLLNGYQAFDRAAHPTPQRVSLNELVRSVAGTTPTPEGQALTMELAEEMPPIQADPQLLEAALRALIRNAIEAGAAGSLRVRTTVGSGSVQLQVQDSGPGLTPEAARQAWDLFYSTRRAHCGAGLPLVARVAEAHHGRAWLTTGPGAGTTVTLELPAAPPA